MHSDGRFLNCRVAEEGCLYISIHRWMQTVTSPTLPSSEGDGSVGAAVYKRHSAVRAHVIIVYGVILVKINGR